jgi:parallel beta-helix repeat protein
MNKRLFLSIGLAAGLALLISVALNDRPVRADPPCTRYVLGIDGSDVGRNCADETHPCHTVQHAINQAVNGDVICVARHTLAGPLVYPERLVITKSITLDGAWDAMCVDPSDLTCVFTPTIPCNPANVTLDAQGLGRVISITNASPTINCFTITGGDAAGMGGDPGGTIEDDAGGGIYGRDASPIIVNNIITGNFGCDVCPVSYGRGGGVYLLNAPATAVISDNLIANNVADNSTWGQGGGIMLRDSAAQVLSNTIQYNRAGLSAGYGGGITIKDGQPTIARNHVLRNTAGQSVQGLGGGIFVWSSTPTTIEQNLIEYNWAIHGDGDPILISRGGGICVTGDPTVSALIRDNTIRFNVASPYTPTGYGGGMYLSNLVSPSLVSGNTVDNNVAGFDWNGNGGGIYVDQSEATIADNDIFDNSATWSGNRGEGGGVYVNGGAVLLSSNVITGNHGAYFTGFPAFAAGYGGGVYINRSLTTTLTSNQIRGNLASRDGGGIYVNQGSPIVSHNGITANQVISGYGGGLYLDNASAQIIGNQIVSNTAPTQGYGGGGVYATGDSSLIQRNSILSNSANYAGGGVYIYSNSSTTVDGNTIAGNMADLYGGGVASRQPNSARVVNNIIARNGANQSGGGVYLYRTETEIIFNTIVDNDAGSDATGIYIGPAASYTPTIVNNIVVSHAVGISNTATGMTPIVDYNDMWGNTTADYAGVAAGAHDIAVDPLFLDPAGSNYHLQAGSPCIDAGTTIVGVNRDIDGDPRPIGILPDIGADEWGRRVLLPLVLRSY